MLAAQLNLDPALPPWALIPAAALFMALAWLTLLGTGIPRRHCVGIWGLRSAAILVISALLLQPAIRRLDRQEQRPVLGIVVDVSASMNDTPPALSDGPQRAERAKDFLEKPFLRTALRKHFRPMMYEIGETASPVDTANPHFRFEAPRSRIMESVATVRNELKAWDVAGILLLSDGLDQSTQTDSHTAPDIPVYPIELEPPLPSEAHEGEDGPLRIADLAYPKRTILEQQAEVRAVLQRRGSGERPVRATLYREGYELETQTATFSGAERFLTVRFSIRPPETGRIFYKIGVTDVRTSQTTPGVAEEFAVDVTDPESRILYLEGTPRWEFKFLKRALLADRNIQLSAYVRAGGGFVNFSQEGKGIGSQMPEFNEELLTTYRVVVVGDLTSQALGSTAWRKLSEAVDRGGGLLVVGGRQAYGADGISSRSALRDLLPVLPSPNGGMQEGRLPVSFTEEGRIHPAMKGLAETANLPPILSVWRPVELSEFASVLVDTASAAPVLAVRRFGQGRVAMVLTNTLWRWRLGSGATVNTRQLYNAFMSQIVHWLLGGSEEDDTDTASLQLLTRQGKVEVGEQVPVGLVGGVADPTGDSSSSVCQVRTPDDRTLRVPLSEAQLGANVGLSSPASGLLGHFTPHTQGEYRLEALSSDGTRQSTLRVIATPPSRELTGRPMDRDFLRSLAEQSGGRFIALDEWDTALADCPREGTVVETVRHTALWTSPWWLVLLIAVFTVEWIWRRRLDLI